MTTISPLIAGNWKMNGLSQSLDELTELAQLLTTGEAPRAVVVVCPPATILAAVAAQGASSGIMAGGQDCHVEASGAHTGDISAYMLADAGAQFVIVGHSERRANHAENDDIVRAKAEAAIGAGLKPIICVGETESERDGGSAESIVNQQLSRSIPDAAEHHEIVVAYEPVWAIGTGRTPTLEEIAQMHANIRARLVERFGEERGNTLRILYGGSMKPLNAREILNVDNVNGGLIGGASLLAKDFYTIISSV
ncbi:MULTISPECIES: triose-phosphate isomerase [unclassified Devosia]|uniref:triose-phosphate isomerase n=1 Tax=unclassified Devosia TaxID=196773 RepID=UPI000ACEEFF1|nr:MULTISPECIES: triose-phosphate isomerase [unclassified Devosia]